MLTKLIRKHRSVQPKRFKKAPHRFALLQHTRLQRVARAAFILGFLFVILSNPFAFADYVRSIPDRLQAMRQQVPVYWQQVQVTWRAIPAFVEVFPSEAEQTAFAAFDWTKAQIEGGWPVFAKELRNDAGKEAGQSAVVTDQPVVDYAAVPFFIEIPKFALREQVFANVNPNDSKEYQKALEVGVAHAKGSAFPGQDKLVYIFGHSTDGAWNVEAYNAVFYQIKDLVAGDEIILHLGDKRFAYVVKEQTVLKGSDVDFINNLQEENLLLLQTCWPPGTTWQRLFVVAKPVSAL